jgi:ribulose bisphosphate carboxylase small subunit
MDQIVRHREWSPGTVILLHCTQKGAVLAIVWRCVDGNENDYIIAVNIDC